MATKTFNLFTHADFWPMVEDRLNREVDDIIKDHLNEMQRESVDYRRMFQLIKNKLARERNLIL